MRRWAQLVLGALLVFATSGSASSQELLIQLDRPFPSASLSAFVFAGDDLPIFGARVELMSPGWKNVLATRETNINGFFKFRQRRLGLYFLRLGARGFQTYKLKVRVKKGVRSLPKISMEVGT